jgi:hypothetical protein
VRWVHLLSVNVILLSLSQKRKNTGARGAPFH